MGNKFAQIAFTDIVKAEQAKMGSRRNYQRTESGPDYHHELTNDEVEFLSRRDSFYISTVSETDWPYIQHRGGPTGFVKVLSPKTFGFADFSGNKQYISVGNLKKNNRVAMIFVDYPNQSRLKVLGTVELIDGITHPEILDKLTPENYNARIERGFLVTVEAFDWNCPQHITPRWTEQEVQQAVLPLQEKILRLEQELASFKGPTQR